jgi:hypothetical protein
VEIERVVLRIVNVLLEQGVDTTNMNNLDHEVLKDFGMTWGDWHTILKALGKA